ncbi:MAG: hypothetical protein H7257_01070 [Taibaiella sp.]|nr:hypothetical protein [Taibaiella sp.]
MLRLFKNNTPFTVIILFIFAILVKLKVLIHPSVPLPEPGHFIYNYILRALFFFFHNNAFSYTLLAIILLFAQSLYVNNITVRHKLFPKNTYIASFVYLLITSIYSRFNFFNETIIINWLLLGALDIMFGFSKTTQPRKLIYNAALLLSVVALFQFTMLAWFLLLVVGMVLFRSFNMGEWSVAILGYVTPLYFIVSILFLLDKLYFLGQWPRYGFSVVPLTTSPLFFIITLCGLVILLFSGIFAMRKNVSMSNIYVRRDWAAISLYLIISIAVAFGTEKTVTSAWLVTLPPLSIMVSHALSFEKNKRFSNFIFYFSIVFLVFCLLVNK